MTPRSTPRLRYKSELAKLDPDFVWSPYSSGLIRYRKRLNGVLSANLPYTFVGLEYVISSMAFFIKLEIMVQLGGVLSTISSSICWHQETDPRVEMERVKALHDTWVLATQTV